jgi:YebC/PmpR family DNA-binding regulatory protein
MSGHSKWSTIKRKKGAADAKRGKAFTKIIKEIMVAARMGGGDINSNPRLRSAVLAGKAENMPKDNIDRAIKKGTGGLEGVNYEEINYEGYGPGGYAARPGFNRQQNRTVADVRHIFSNIMETWVKRVVSPGCSKTKGLILIDKAGVEEDKLLEVALDAGALDVKDNGKEFEVTVSPVSYEEVKKKIEEAGLATHAEVTMDPNHHQVNRKEAEQGN